MYRCVLFTTKKDSIAIGKILKHHCMKEKAIVLYKFFFLFLVEGMRLKRVKTQKNKTTKKKKIDIEEGWLFWHVEKKERG